jgi:hypothetical protein
MTLRESIQAGFFAAGFIGTLVWITNIYMHAFELRRKIETRAKVKGVFSQLLQWPFLRSHRLRQIIDAAPELAAQVDRLDKKKYAFMAWMAVFLFFMTQLGKLLSYIGVG